MKYLSDPVKSRGSEASSLAPPGEAIILHVVLAILVDGILLACEAQDVHVCTCVLDCGSDAPCGIFGTGCGVNCHPVE